MVLVAGMDTVDVTAVDRSLAHHDYFLENDHVLADIFQLLSYGVPPQKRLSGRPSATMTACVPLWRTTAVVSTPRR